LPSAEVEFKRDLTVKLPLPVRPDDDDDEMCADDVAVCQSMTSQDGGGEEWTVVDGPLRLTRNSVAFDTRTMSK